MKILFLTDGIHPYQIGGMQKHSLILSRLLAARGIDLHIFHVGGDEYGPQDFERRFQPYHDKISETVIPFPKTDSFPGHYIRENRKYSQLIFEAVQEKLDMYDLVYAQGFTGGYFIRQRKKGNTDIPVMVNFHGFEMFQKAASFKAKLEHQLLKKEVRFNVKNADAVYSFGGQIDQILYRLGVPQERIFMQSNGIEEEWVIDQLPETAREKVRTFTFIGRNERRKGIEELSAALKSMIRLKDGPNFQFNFIGPVPDAVKIKDERIKYFGEIRDSVKVREILLQSDCLVCPSHSEGMPTVILEAMACGLALIATDVGAVSRMIKNNGILLKAPNPELLKNAIKMIVHLPADDLQQMKLRSLELVKESFLWDVIADKTVAQFARLLEPKQ